MESQTSRTPDVVAEELWALLSKRELGGHDEELNESIGKLVREFVQQTSLKPDTRGQTGIPEVVHYLDPERGIRFQLLQSRDWIARAVMSDRLRAEQRDAQRAAHMESGLQRRRAEFAGPDDPLDRAERAIEKIDKIRF